MLIPPRKIKPEQETNHTLAAIKKPPIRLIGLPRMRRADRQHADEADGKH